MGFTADDNVGYVGPKDIINVGEALTPGEDYMYVGGGGAINIPYFPSTSIPFYVPPLPSISQTPSASQTTKPSNTQLPAFDLKGEDAWVYVMIMAMMVIIVIVLAVVL
jgi:hypothetical protein